MKIKYLISLALLIFLMLNDFYSRLDWNSSIAESNNAFSNANLGKERKISQGVVEQVLQKYEVFNPVAEDAVTKDPQKLGMTLAEQNQQRGILDQLYAGDVRIVLQAVISQVSDSIYAVIRIENVVTNSSDMKKIELNQLLYGYRVIDLELNKVQLQSVDDPNRTVTLHVYRRHQSIDS